MLFKPEHVPLILNGSKTQTRRLWLNKKIGQILDYSRVKVGKIYKCKTKMISKEFFARIKIIRTWKDKLGDISLEDAIAEGYKNPNDYFRAFFKIAKVYMTCDRNRMKGEEVWCVEFKLAKQCGWCKWWLGYLIENQRSCRNKESLEYSSQCESDQTACDLFKPGNWDQNKMFDLPKSNDELAAMEEK